MLCNIAVQNSRRRNQIYLRGLRRRDGGVIRGIRAIQRRRATADSEDRGMGEVAGEKNPSHGPISSAGARNRNDIRRGVEHSSAGLEHGKPLIWRAKPKAVHGSKSGNEVGA